ncbi:hypothetical protein [Streptomyces sp. H27-D2]|uniref:hypothetical protein n=1 Tax=Streptomyces sp. H27-D2 TaxID=3046304 RepID=UPI002DBE05E7|nr:hypothetical protein [Streptomyces sp. H27-D2]MEC4015346.1 hypothetical protein [Streptomyces sp. H27-D2]
MVRNVIGSVVAVIGAAAAVRSPFKPWYQGRQGRDFAVDDLFRGITSDRPDLAASLLLPMAFAAVLALIGLLLRSRLLTGFAGVVALGFTVLWMVRQGQESGTLTVGGDGEGLGLGVAYAFGGGLLLLIAAVIMSGRRSLGRRPSDTGGPGQPHAPYPEVDSMGWDTQGHMGHHQPMPEQGPTTQTLPVQEDVGQYPTQYPDQYPGQETTGGHPVPPPPAQQPSVQQPPVHHQSATPPDPEQQAPWPDQSYGEPAPWEAPADRPPAQQPPDGPRW